MSSTYKFALLATASSIALGAIAASVSAQEITGEWPQADRKISIQARNEPVSTAATRAATLAGMNLVIALPEDPRVTVSMRNVTLQQALRAMFLNQPVRIDREEGIITVRTLPPAPIDPSPPPVAAPVAVPLAAAAPTPLVAPTNSAHSDDGDSDDGDDDSDDDDRDGRHRRSRYGDRVTFGADVFVPAGETVRDVFSMGGNAIVEGTVERDVVTMGGSATIKKGAIVKGSVVTMGGNLEVQEGAKVHRDLVPLGGTLTVHKDGKRTVQARGRHVGWSWGDDHEPSSRAYSHHDFEDSFLGKVFRKMLQFGLLFLVTLALIGLVPRRFIPLETAIRKEPLRVSMLGVAGLFGTLALIGVLIVTLIGIPVAVVVAVALFFAFVIGLAAVGTSIGRALPVTQLTSRPFLQVALGIGILFLVSLVPWFGFLTIVSLSVVGLGAIVHTRFREATDDTGTALVSAQAAESPGGFPGV